MKIVEVLTQLGASAGAATLSTLPPSLCSTALETIQRLAFTDRGDALEEFPPLVFEETGLLSRLQLWGGGGKPLCDGYKSGAGVPPREAVCIGGVIVQISAETWKPATVLYQSDLLILFIPACEFTPLEAELESTTPSLLENHIFGSATAEQTRRLLPQLTGFSRKAGVASIPPHLVSTIHLVRDGPLPWLRIRSPGNTQEKTELHQLLSKFPVANPKTASTLLEKCEIAEFRLQTIISRAKLGPLPNPLVSTAVELIDAPIVAPLALVILGQCKRTNKLLEATEACSIDVANEDVEGTPQIGNFHAVQKQALVLAKQEEEEAAEIEVTVPKLTPAEAIAASTAAATALRPPPPPVNITLSDLARLVQRKFDVKQVAGSFCVDGIEQLIKQVTRVHDCNLLRQMLDNLPRNTAAFDSLHEIIKICDRKYAFLIVSVQGVHLFTSSNRHTIDTDAAARLLLCPWVTPIVFNFGAIGVVTVDGVSRWPITLDDGIRVARLALNKNLPAEVSRAMTAAASSGEKMQSLTDRLVEFETNLASQLAAVSAATALQSADYVAIQQSSTIQPNPSATKPAVQYPVDLPSQSSASTASTASTASAASVDTEGTYGETTESSLQPYKRSSEETMRAVTRRKIEVESTTTASWKALMVS